MCLQKKIIDCIQKNTSQGFGIKKDMFAFSIINMDGFMYVTNIYCIYKV